MRTREVAVVSRFCDAKTRSKMMMGEPPNRGGIVYTSCAKGIRNIPFNMNDRPTVTITSVMCG